MAEPSSSCREMTRSERQVGRAAVVAGGIFSPPKTNTGVGGVVTLESGIVVSDDVEFSKRHLAELV
jgi:hypothetical protein